MINETLKTLKTTYKKESLVKNVHVTLKRMLHYHAIRYENTLRRKENIPW